MKSIIESPFHIVLAASLIGCVGPTDRQRLHKEDLNSEVSRNETVPLRTLRYDYVDGFILLSNFTSDGYCSYRIPHRREDGIEISLGIGRLSGDTIHEVVQVSDHNDDGGEDAVISHGDALFVFEANRITDEYNIYSVDKKSREVTKVQDTHYLSHHTLRGLFSFSDIISGRIVTWGGKLYRMNYLPGSTELDLQAVDGKGKYKIQLPGEPYRIMDLDSGSIVMDFKPPLEKCVVIEPPELGPPVLKEVTLSH